MLYKNRWIIINEIVDTLLEGFTYIIVFESRERINGNAAILKNFNNLYIFVDKNLSKNIKAFSILHEIAHIYLNIYSEKGSVYDEYDENRVNLKAISFIKRLISKEQYVEMISICNSNSEDIFYKYIAKNKFIEYKENLKY